MRKGLLLLTLSISCWAQLPRSPCTLSWTVPAGINQVFVRARGPGGSGAGGNTNYSGSPGSGGGYAEGPCAVTPGGSVTVTIGRGGAAPAAGANGNPGDSNSSFGSCVIAGPGGKGYANSSSLSDPPGYDGLAPFAWHGAQDGATYKFAIASGINLGATNEATLKVVDKWSGGWGPYGQSGTGAGYAGHPGWGGGGSGGSGARNHAGTEAGGAGGASGLGGAGGAGGGVNSGTATACVAGSTPGGGGGGGTSDDGGDTVGCAGGDGRVEIYY